MEFFLISSLNGLSYGLLLFMLSSGLTLIFSMMGVLNFAHASFYMLGAYFGYTLESRIGFWPALVLAPALTGAAGALFESKVLRKVHKLGHVSELLVTFGLSYIVLELVQLLWGRVAVEFNPPVFLQGPVFTLINHGQLGLSLVSGAGGEMCQSADTAVRVVCTPFPATRAFIMGTAVAMVISLWWVLTRTRAGLIIQAALTHPETVETLGHNVPRVFMLVFAMGTGLAGLAGVIGGFTFITEPAMAATVGSVIFVVVVVGGMGSLSGAFLASVVIGVVQTFAVAIDYSLLQLFKDAGLPLSADWKNNSVIKLTVSQVAPILPYLLLVLILIFRPRGLLGKRDT
ncbi:MAG: branched-chain amino acid ABC transporter permease [Betaproteobacteria bacterium]|nr:branched-chain amino acid ABC transporter permease [Betaproteobacteria bacterium]